MGGGEEGEDIFGFEIFGEGVGKFNFGFESVGGVLGLGDGYVCMVLGC